MEIISKIRDISEAYDGFLEFKEAKGLRRAIEQLLQGSQDISVKTKKQTIANQTKRKTGGGIPITEEERGS